MIKKIAFALVLSAALPSMAENYAGFVNVGGAIPDGLFREVVTNAVPGSVPISPRFFAEDKIDIAALIAEAAKGVPNGERKLSVYFVNSKDFPPQISVPKRFAVINVRGLDKGADPKLYELRILKMALKGFAFACGFGANQDVGRCVMATGSFDTLKGIDATSASYSPFCYFPMTDYLQSIGLIYYPPEEEVEEEPVEAQKKGDKK